MKINLKTIKSIDKEIKRMQNYREYKQNNGTLNYQDFKKKYNHCHEVKFNPRKITEYTQDQIIKMFPIIVSENLNELQDAKSITTMLKKKKCCYCIVSFETLKNGINFVVLRKGNLDKELKPDNADRITISKVKRVVGNYQIAEIWYGDKNEME